MRFVHLTDLHLPIPGAPSALDLINKRVLGYLSWVRNRRFRHRLDALEALIADSRDQKPDLTVITGDAINIALPSEFAEAGRRFAGWFDPENTLFTPGNHDTYVSTDWRLMAQAFGPFMRGSREPADTPRVPVDETDFPYVREAGPVSFIMANSSPPTLPGLATGRLGDEQIVRIGKALRQAKAEGRARVLALHHPVTKGATPRRKALDDDRALRQVIAEEGVELVIHGHTHRTIWARVDTPEGPRPVAGGASASHPEGRGHYRPARYTLFSVAQAGSAFRIEATVRELDPASGKVETAETRTLLPI
jgi:3',5'-cyclic AMP phosphodiesterase CpdA